MLEMKRLIRRRGSDARGPGIRAVGVLQSREAQAGRVELQRARLGLILRFCNPCC